LGQAISFKSVAAAVSPTTHDSFETGWNLLYWRISGAVTYDMGSSCNLPLTAIVEEFWKSVNICQSYATYSSYWLTVYIDKMHCVWSSCNVNGCFTDLFTTLGALCHSYTLQADMQDIWQCLLSLHVQPRRRQTCRPPLNLLQTIVHPVAPSRQLTWRV